MIVHLVSSPRGRSTALLYAFGRRGDAAVVDEPFYAYYLARSGADHPGRAEVLTFQPTAAAAAVAHLRERLAAAGRAHGFVKDMGHHLRPLVADLGGDEPLPEARRVFLVRDPRDAIPSYAAVHPHPTSADIGLVDQYALWRADRERGLLPLVVDADDLAAAPLPTLRALCEALALPFTPDMATWPPGYLPDAVPWAPYWYRSVQASGGLAPQRSTRRPLPADCVELLAAVAPLYAELRAHRLPVAR